MKKRILSAVLIMSMVFGLVACGGTAEEAETTEEATEATEETGEKPEVDVVRFSTSGMGNVLITIAKDQGYLEEAGIEVEEIPVEGVGTPGLSNGQIDVVAGDGTSYPLMQIAAGEDLTIFGGQMLTGCVPIIAKKGTEWNGVESFVGKKVAAPAYSYALTGPLKDAGYDPLKDVEWVTFDTTNDRISAVRNGEVDFAQLSTSFNYQVSQMDDIEIVCYQSDIMPNYSCCRMLATTEFVENNPIALKLITKAMIRAQEYLENHREEVVPLLAKTLDVEEAYVESFMLNDHLKLNADPLKKTVMYAWDVMDETGFLSEEAKNVNVEDHINTEIYETALNELIADAEIYDENPEFYDSALAFFEEYNK